MDSAGGYGAVGGHAHSHSGGRAAPDFVWGGMATDSTRLYLLEALALLLLALFAWIVARRVRIIGTGQPGLGVRIGAWVVFAYMTLNILGNLASGMSLERLLFAPVTLILALLALRVAVE